MNHQYDTILKQRFVSAIKTGLGEAQAAFQNNGKQFNNAKNFAKMDYIANSVAEAFEIDPNFNVVSFQRGSYAIALIYDLMTGILYSLMSSTKFEELLNRTDYAHVHYIDGLVHFNEKLGYDRMQLMMNDDMFERDDDRIDRIKDKIRCLLNGTEPSKYKTIAFSMDRYNLLGVEAILTSEYWEVVDRDDWSEFIEIDFSDISYDDLYMIDGNGNRDDELSITLRTDIVLPGDMPAHSVTMKVDEMQI